ncbi:GPCR fungal pheromone mating factor [Amylostereum chailletii]|nr:GPCR fungal pheromone mating factor [Amylostereum chailletii]
MDPTYPLVPFMNILSAVLLSLTLLTFALRRKANIGVVMLGVWLLIIAIWVGVDTIVWAKDARDVAPVWCKIWAHIAIAADVGGPACCTVINRRLHNILCSPQLKKPGKRERIRALAFDICLGVGLPLFMMALVSIIRPVKYVIQQEYGCSSTVPASALSIVLIAGWTVFFPALSILWYCRKPPL